MGGLVLDVDAVVFDIGETLVDESRTWESWADWLGVPRLTLMGLIGWGAANDVQPGEVVHLLRPDVDIREEMDRRRQAGIPAGFVAGDIYPDVVPALRGIVAAGVRVGIAGNQPTGVEDMFQEMGVELALCVSSGTWKLAKPDPRFFARVAESLALPPNRVAYVGDRLDYDVLASQAAGMVAVHLRRGPWGWTHAMRPEITRADLRIDSLLQLLQE